MSNVTDAEMLGNMDGVILATIISTIKKKLLSEILNYEVQSVTFTKSFYNSKATAEWWNRIEGTFSWEWRSVDFNSETSRAYVLNKVPSTMQEYYKKLYKTC